VRPAKDQSPVQSVQSANPKALSPKNKSFASRATPTLPSRRSFKQTLAKYTPLAHPITSSNTTTAVHPAVVTPELDPQMMQEDGCANLTHPTVHPRGAESAKPRPVIEDDVCPQPTAAHGAHREAKGGSPYSAPSGSMCRAGNDSSEEDEEELPIAERLRRCVLLTK
jgi:hypothetical protein